MNKDQENKHKQSEAGKKKAGKTDIGNNLEKDARGEFGSNNPTPQARTDNEEDRERKKNKQ